MLKKIVFILIFLPHLTFAQTTAIGQETFRYKDTVRNRPVITEVWYPTDADVSKASTPPEYPFMRMPTIRNAPVPPRKFPLIMLSHGTGGGRLTMEWLVDILVQKGFIVAAVDHWGNTFDHKEAIDFVTPWERALDISFALTQLLDSKEFGGAIDKERIGATGFSIGGYTVLALAGGKLNLDALNHFVETPAGAKEIAIPEFPNLKEMVNKDEVRASFHKSPDLKDKRIKAFFAICPAIGQGFVSEKQFEHVHDPIYIVGAQSDSIAPVKTNAMHYHKLIKGSKLLIIPGMTGHYVFLNEAIDQVKEKEGKFFADDQTVNRYAVHEQVGNEAAKFFLTTLR
ncbi:alpha/beta hydrolase family protein [Pedobacter cryoconitis]|uniref:Putative dienelactone hydrolase n=1 Tax=Pedobacter cryoconitis TaxID=188932 RepID=A0A7X0J153_9SPHI|nr:dienelactone hydrolase [Pedobacter cryoconitis]MBB6498517.1 putative dienelactone hydrolase [Pedobacter cryoconitis]